MKPLEAKETSQFRRDVRKLIKQGKNLEELFSVIETLIEARPLPEKYRNHGLAGNWQGYQECHVRPDWLLIYRIEEDTLYLARSGSHSELF
jgi:mRNA interferase YafQ